MKLAVVIVGVLLALLGGLWLGQGLGLVRIEPIACVAACEAVEGPSLLWAGIGFVVCAAGVLMVILALKRRRRA